jgi:hypothetical protein
MEPERVDKQRAKQNPWGLTPHQCMALRLVCAHGGSKRAAYKTGEPERLIEHHIYGVRKAMQMKGADIRIYLEWDRWSKNENGNKRMLAEPTATKGSTDETD